MHAHLSWTGLAEGVLLFLAVWWAWVYTTWATNWLDPERLPVRVLLVLLMLASLVMAVALPQAFDDGAVAFAVAYVLIQLGRALYITAVFHLERETTARTQGRIAVWFLFSAGFWIWGALAPAHERLGWWALALAIEYAGPAAFYWTPGLGRASTHEWNISGSHMAERCALFIILSLGEGIIVTGSRYAENAPEAGLIAAFLLSFAGSVLMWWLYFDVGAERGARHIENHAEPGRVARNAYTYLHMPIVAGIVIVAVSDALLIDHWDEVASEALVVTFCGGTMVYLAGLGLFKRFTERHGAFPLSHSTALALLALLAITAWVVPLPTLALVGAGIAILAAAALWEWGAYHLGWSERLDRLLGRAVIGGD